MSLVSKHTLRNAPEVGNKCPFADYYSPAGVEEAGGAHENTMGDGAGLNIQV